jgi:hypothetical protein
MANAQAKFQLYSIQLKTMSKKFSALTPELMNANTSAIEDLSPKSTILTTVNKWSIILIKS